MNSFKRLLTCLVIPHFVLQPTNQFNFRPKHFKVENIAPCSPAPSTYGGKFERLDLSQPTKYLFHLDADIRFIKDVTEPLQFVMKFFKCTSGDQVSNCDESETMKVNDVCDRFSDKNAIWTPLMNIIKPKLLCPIKKGVYIIRNGTFDLSLISRLPLDGFRYVTTMSLYEMVKNATKPLQLMCLDSDVNISLLSSGRPRNKG